MDPSLLVDAIYILRSTGEDSTIGLNGPGPAKECVVNKHFHPDELDGVIAKDKLVWLQR